MRAKEFIKYAAAKKKEDINWKIWAPALALGGGILGYKGYKLAKRVGRMPKPKVEIPTPKPTAPKPTSRDQRLLPPLTKAERATASRMDRLNRLSESDLENFRAFGLVTPEEYARTTIGAHKLKEAGKTLTPEQKRVSDLMKRYRGQDTKAMSAKVKAFHAEQYGYPLPHRKAVGKLRSATRKKRKLARQYYKETGKQTGPSSDLLRRRKTMFPDMTPQQAFKEEWEYIPYYSRPEPKAFFPRRRRKS